jgi:IS5 family transposase
MDNFSQFHPQVPSFSGSFSEIDSMSDTADFFRNRLDQMIDLRHPLVVSACRMPQQELEASIAHLFAKAVRAGRTLDGLSDLLRAGRVDIHQSERVPRPRQVSRQGGPHRAQPDESDVHVSPLVR